jgi:hypothetical protein
MRLGLMLYQKNIQILEEKWEASILKNEVWISELYVFFIYIHWSRYMNELNKKLQGKNQLIPDMYSHIVFWSEVETFTVSS